MLPRLVHVCLFHLLHDTVFGSSDLARSSVSSFSGSLGRLTSLTGDLARASENSCAAYGTRARAGVSCPWTNEDGLATGEARRDAFLCTCIIILTLCSAFVKLLCSPDPFA